jgi:hypothetical protein
MEDKQADARYWERLNAATKAFNTSDPPSYKGEATREYQKELSRKLLAHGPEKTLANPQIRFEQDVDIAARLQIAGHSKQEVAKALTKASPEAGKLQTEQEQKAYGELVSSKAIEHEKVRAQIAKTTQLKIEQERQDERRLDKIGDLATDDGKNKTEYGKEKNKPTDRSKQEQEIQQYAQRSQQIVGTTREPSR